MHEAKINNTIIHYPSEWDELTRGNLELIAGLSLMKFESVMTFKSYLLFYIAGIQITKTNFNAKILGKPIEISKSFRDPGNASEEMFKVKLADDSIAFLSASQITTLANGFDFLIKKSKEKDEKEGFSLDCHLTRNIIPSFKVSGTIYYGPSDKLFNITYSEFIHAETNLTRFNQSKDVECLDKLIAILYRPQKNPVRRISNNYDGDRRTPFNDHKFEKRAVKIHKLNHNVKMCIYLFYTGCQWWIQQQFPHVFSHKSGSSDNKLGYLGLTDALTGGDVTKTNQIRQSYLMDVMVHLERAAIDYEKMQEDLKKK